MRFIPLLGTVCWLAIHLMNVAHSPKVLPVNADVFLPSLLWCVCFVLSIPFAFHRGFPKRALWIIVVVPYELLSWLTYQEGSFAATLENMPKYTNGQLLLRGMFALVVWGIVIILVVYFLIFLPIVWCWEKVSPPLIDWLERKPYADHIDK